MSRDWSPTLFAPNERDVVGLAERRLEVTSLELVFGSVVLEVVDATRVVHIPEFDRHVRVRPVRVGARLLDVDGVRVKVDGVELPLGVDRLDLEHIVGVAPLPASDELLKGFEDDLVAGVTGGVALGLVGCSDCRNCAGSGRGRGVGRPGWLPAPAAKRLSLG